MLIGKLADYVQAGCGSNWLGIYMPGCALHTRRMSLLGNMWAPGLDCGALCTGPGGCRLPRGCGAPDSAGAPRSVLLNSPVFRRVSFVERAVNVVRGCCRPNRKCVTSTKVFWENMKVIITGGAAFIGSNAVHRYLQRGDTVIVVDDLSRCGTEKNL